MKNKSFEEDMKRLQEIVAKLESGEEPLEDSMKLFEEGTRLSAGCYETLKRAEQKITEFSKLQEAEENRDEE